MVVSEDIFLCVAASISNSGLCGIYLLIASLVIDCNGKLIPGNIAGIS